MEFPYRWGGPTYLSKPRILIFLYWLNHPKMQRNFSGGWVGGTPYPFKVYFDNKFYNISFFHELHLGCPTSLIEKTSFPNLSCNIVKMEFPYLVAGRGGHAQTMEIPQLFFNFIIDPFPQTHGAGADSLGINTTLFLFI